MFYDNGNLKCVFDKILYKIHFYTTQNDDVPVSEKLIFFDIPYVGKPSNLFHENIFRLILKVSDVKDMPIYRIFKVGNYFKLKSHTPLPLVFNTVY